MYEPHKPYTLTDLATGVTYQSFPPLDEHKVKRSEVEHVDQPEHYTWHPMGIEAKDIAQEFSYNIGTAIAYLWRHEYKNGIEDLKKAVKHIEFEIQRLEKE